MPPTRALIVTTLALVLGCATPLAAQPTPGFQGLFAPRGESAGARQSLDVVVALFEEYGDAAQADSGRPFGSTASGFRLVSGVAGNLSYTHRGPRTVAGLRGTASTRYYRETSAFTAARFSEEFQLVSTFGTGRSSFSMRQSVAREPYFQAPLFGALSAGSAIASPVAAISRDDALFVRQAWIYSGGVALEQPLSQRATVGFSGAATYTDFTGTGSSLRDVQAGARFSERVGKYLALRAGYDFRRGEYRLPVAVTTVDVHGVDLGLDYRRPLSKSRRTVLAFGTGSAYAPSLGGSKYRFEGFVTLSREMLNGWRARADYRRGVQFVAGFTAPFYADIVTATLGGYVTRRVEVSGALGYSTGEVGVRRDRYDSMQASGRLRFAVARAAALETVYLYYAGDFGRVAPTPELGSVLRRQAVRVTVVIWLPIAHR